MCAPPLLLLVLPLLVLLLLVLQVLRAVSMLPLRCIAGARPRLIVWTACLCLRSYPIRSPCTGCMGDAGSTLCAVLHAVLLGPWRLHRLPPRTTATTASSPIAPALPPRGGAGVSGSLLQACGCMHAAVRVPAETTATTEASSSWFLQRPHPLPLPYPLSQSHRRPVTP